MLKQEITYEDFNGDETTESFYFNISKSELIEMEVEYDGGFTDYIQRIIKAEDRRGLIREFKRLILIAYGEKSSDGKRFIKSDELRTEFSQTNAYNTLFMKLATDDGAAAKFLTGLMPKDLAEQLEQDKPDLTTVVAPIAETSSPSPEKPAS